MEDSQSKQVLQYLRTHPNGITSLQAFSLYDATRLSAIIFNLKKRGIRITTIIEKSKEKGKRTKRYARYVLEDE